MNRLRLYGFLVGLMVAILLICDTVAFKVITIFGHDFAASGLIFPFSFLLASIITEVYGYQLAGRIIWIQLFCQLIFIVTVNALVYAPSPTSSNVPALYLGLYHSLWHVLFASTLAVFCAYFINDFIMSKLKITLYGKWFFIRFILANGIGKAILVSISYPINLYNLYNTQQIISIAIDTWIYKMIMAILLLPIAFSLSYLIKKVENLDYYDYGVSYNPLTVFSPKLFGKNCYAEPETATE